MATRTSTQSGNFNSTTTWGGNPVPVDGDSFVVANGHIVTINDDRRVTNGFNDSTVNGKLHITGTGKLRMNGILYINNNGNHLAHFSEGNSSTGGFFRMDPGSILEIRGTNADQHRLHINPIGYITCEIEGTNPNPQTTLAANASNNSTSISLTDASQFAPGDWINIYKSERAGLSWAYYKSDEAVWIHDIDYLNDTIYFRQFVSPTTTITAVSNNLITVVDSTVFRIGYQIIFGTGSNRNIKTITDINYNSNIITLNSSVVGSVVNESIYQTGLNKGHLSGDDVLRIAAVLTADSNAGSNTIAVNNTNGFSVGDLILLPVNDPVYSNASSWDHVMDYTISAIDTNTKTITLSAGYTNPSQSVLEKNIKAGVGGLVVNMNRDTKVIAPEGTSYGDDQASFIFFQYFNNGSWNFRRHFKLKNFLLNLGSNTASIEYRSICIRGHNGYDLTSYNQYTSEFDGVVIYPSKRNTDNTGYLWEQHQLNIRNCVMYNANGHLLYTYGNNRGVYSNICCRGLYAAGSGSTYEPFSEYCYNFGIRTLYGSFYEQCTDSKMNISFNYLLFCRDRLIYHTYSVNPLVIKRHYFDNFLIWPEGQRIPRTIFLDCYFGNYWDVTGGGNVYSDSINLAGQSYYELNRTSAHTHLYSSICHNFKYNNTTEWNRTALRWYDNNLNAWRVYPDRNSNNWMGFDNHVYVPANTTVYVKGAIKTVAGNTNYPYIRVSPAHDYYNGKFYNNDDTALVPSDSNVTSITGWEFTSRFTSSSVNDFEEKTITLDPLPFDCFMSISISCNGSGSNSRLGWYEKDLQIILSNPVPFIVSSQMINNLTTRLPVVVQQTSNQLKTILGG